MAKSATGISDSDEMPTSESFSTPTPLDNDTLGISQRMFSASVGSILTACFLTPLDVVRIRMQQQELLPKSLTCCDRHSLFWVNPNCKTDCARIMSTVQGLQSISRHEGVVTLWRGMSLNLIMAIPANVVYFTGYEYVRDHSPISGWQNSLLCGLMARLVAATVISPIELLKTRLQSVPSNVSTHVMKDIWNLTQKGGVKSLFTGLQITLWRDVPFSGIYWALYEYSKATFSLMLGIRGLEDHSKIFVASFLSGSLAGSVAAVATHPFDVGKTRLQICLPNNTKMFQFLYDIVRNEGPAALLGGLGPRVLKVAPSCAIMILAYEITKTFFATRQSKSL